MDGVEALLHGEGDRQCFDGALALPTNPEWPFELARVRLAYGERLRRMRAPADARVQLSAAAETFGQLGAKPWYERAVNEARATGITGPRRTGAEVSPLTPQQREIVELATSGLTNKQIGERLFLSHRTVAWHLYQVYPKLGISSRAALRDALTALPDDAPAEDHVCGRGAVSSRPNDAWVNGTTRKTVPKPTGH